MPCWMKWSLTSTNDTGRSHHWLSHVHQNMHLLHFIRNSEFFSHIYGFFLIIPAVIACKLPALLLKSRLLHIFCTFYSPWPEHLVKNVVPLLNILFFRISLVNFLFCFPNSSLLSIHFSLPIFLAFANSWCTHFSLPNFCINFVSKMELRMQCPKI